MINETRTLIPLSMGISNFSFIQDMGDRESLHPDNGDKKRSTIYSLNFYMFFRRRPLAGLQKEALAAKSLVSVDRGQRINKLD